MLSCEICEIFKNTCKRLLQKIFTETLSMLKSHNIAILQRMNGLILLRSETVDQRSVLSKSFLRNFVKFTGKHLCQCLLFNTCNFVKKETLAQVFSCKFYKNSKTPFFTKILQTLLLWVFLYFVFRFIFNLLLENALAGLSKHLKQNPLKKLSYPLLRLCL